LSPRWTRCSARQQHSISSRNDAATEVMTVNDELAALNNAGHLYAGIVSTSGTENIGAAHRQQQLLLQSPFCGVACVFLRIIILSIIYEFN